MQFELRELEERIVAAKKFLKSEMTSIRTDNGMNLLSLQEVGMHMDTIHEVERTGLRHIGEMEFIRISRVLTNVEARMSLPKN